MIMKFETFFIKDKQEETIFVYLNNLVTLIYQFYKILSRNKILVICKLRFQQKEKYQNLFFNFSFKNVTNFSIILE